LNKKKNYTNFDTPTNSLTLDLSSLRYWASTACPGTSGGVLDIEKIVKKMGNIRIKWYDDIYDIFIIFWTDVLIFKFYWAIQFIHSICMATKIPLFIVWYVIFTKAL
jgi:hypothetical protein